MNSHLFIVGQVTIISNVNGDAFPARVVRNEHRRAVGGPPWNQNPRQSQAPFLFDYLMIENNQTLVPNKNAASFLDNFFGVKWQNFQFQSCSQATRLSRGLQTMLGVGGSVRQASGFFGSWAMLLELGEASIMTY